MRDYWSTQPDVQVSYVANIMPRKRFERIRANRHFANNEEPFPWNYPNHDRAGKVKPLILHFNKAYQAAKSSQYNVLLTNI